MESCNRTHIIARPELVTFLYMALRQQKALTMTVRCQIMTDLKRRTVPQQSLARDCVEVRQQLLHYHNRNISNWFAKHGHKGSQVFRTAYASFSWSSFAFQPKHLRNVSMQLKGGTSITVQVRHAGKICCGRLEGSCRKKKEILPEARSEWHVVTLDSHSCPTPQYSCSQVPRGPHWPHPLNLNRISLQCLWRFVKRHGYKAISTLLKRCRASLRKVWSSLARGWYANNNCVEDPVGQSCSIVLRFQCFKHVKHL